MHAESNTDSKLDLFVKNTYSSDSDDGKKREKDTAKNQKQKKFGWFPIKPSKPSEPSKTKNPRRKSILKPSKMLDKSSFEEATSKSRFIRKKGGQLNLDDQDISEIERVHSTMNDEIPQQEDFRMKEDNEGEKAATRIPNFGFLSKHSPKKDDSLDISSPIAKTRPPAVTRQDTDDLKINGLIASLNQGKTDPKLLRIPLTEHQEFVRNSRPATDRSNFNETPLFKMDRDQPHLFEANKINTNSLSALNNEDNTMIDYWAREDRGGAKIAHSLIIDSYSKQLSGDSVQSRSGIKQTAGVLEGNKLSRFKKGSPGLNALVQDENKNQQTLIPRLTEKEIVDTFYSIDINKDGYITADEIACFFEVLEENATDAEIDEMIRMLDYEGSGRVRIEEFFKLATGKDLSSNRRVSVSDPTKNADISKLDRINDNTASYFINKDSFVGIMKKDSMSISDSNTFLKDYERKASNPGFQRKESQAGESDKRERAMYIKEFMRQTGLDENTFLEKYPKSIHNQSALILNYKDFLSYFGLKDGELSQYVFFLFQTEKGFIDLKEVLIAVILNLSLSLEEKLSLAYDLYDSEDNGYILYSETFKIIKVLQIGEDAKKIEKKLQTILKKMNILYEDSISREEFSEVCKHFPNLIRF